ncbi:MAG: RNA pyrophosphohydrolase [Rhodospirillaceae bacterium]|jgi:putative (di)nucleoside polyphosphate hydrolase|nr:RNA pyrophosphohydrolase [Rhodospirillaceae bacterium]
MTNPQFLTITNSDDQAIAKAERLIDGRLYRLGVGIALRNRLGQVFVGQRSDSSTAWQMPQGGLDDGESPLQALWRELKEEVGIDARQARLVAMHPEWLHYDLTPDLIGRLWNSRYQGQCQRWFALDFIGEPHEIAIDDSATTPAEFQAWRWQDIDALPDIIVDFKRDLYGTLRDWLAGL